MRSTKFFSNRKVSSTETRSTGPSHQSTVETPSSVASGSNAASGILPTALNDSSEANQPRMVPQSINNTLNDRDSSSADQPPRRADPAINDTDKLLSALQAVAGMGLPLGLPEVARSASQLLTLFENKRRNDDGVRLLIVDISKIIIGLVGKIHPTATTEHEQTVTDVLRDLETLHTYCEEYLQRNWFSRFIFSSAWKAKIDDIHRRVQSQLIFVGTTAILEVLERLNTHQQQIATPPSGDNSFRNAEFRPHCDADINSFPQYGLKQSLPVPTNHDSSNAFENAKFLGGKVKITNHAQHFG